MISNEELSSLLTALYAAPLEPEMWQVFFGRLCDLTQISCGYLIGSYPDEGNRVLAGGGTSFDSEVFRLYNEHYGASDPYRAPLLANPRIGLISGEELVDHASLVASELYNEVLSRYDLEYMNMLSCTYSEGNAELLSLWRSPERGPMDRASCQLLGALLPHLQIALRLRAKVLKYEAANVLSEAALDAMSIAAFLVTCKGRICHMNQRAAAYLRENSGLRLHLGSLTAANSQEAAQLKQLLQAATSNRRDRPEVSPGGAMMISQPADGTRLQVTVIPAPEQNLVTESESCAVMFVSAPGSSQASRATVLRQLYRLTPTECRLADLLLEGLDVRDAAGRLAITLETARFHVKRVLAKTGTRRQTELMRLMLSLPAYPDRGENSLPR
jgi:DNA-binding CsgD family transcriptional regulator/PAS domain-containing protein